MFFFLKNEFSNFLYCAGTIIVQEAGGVVTDMNLEDRADIFNRRFFALSSESIGTDISQKINIQV